MTTERIDIIVSERGSRVVKRNIEGIGSGSRAAAGGVQFLQRALLSLGVGLGVAQLIRMADTYTMIINRLKLVTSGTDNLARVNDELFASAQRTRSSYEDTATLYATVARSAQTLGLGQQDLLDITETVNQSIAVSGTSAQAASAGLGQLSQALGSGVLRGEELNSIMENMPRLAQAIADGMGITVGQLRTLGEEGALTSQAVVEAIQKSAPAIAAEFAQITPTVGSSIQALSDSFMRSIGELDQSLGITAALANAILFLANNMDTLGQIAAVVAVALAAAFAVSLVGSITAIISQVIALELALGATSTASALFGAALKIVQGGVRALTAAIAANPIGLLLVAITTIISYLYIFRDEISVTADGVVSLGDVFRAIFSFIGELIGPVVDFFKQVWSDGVESVKGAIGTFLTTIIDVMSAAVDIAKTAANLYIGLWVGAYNAIIAGWNLFPGAMRDLAVLAMNGLIDIIAAGIQGVLNGIQSLLTFIGSAAELVGRENPFANMIAPDAIASSLEQFKGTVSGAAGELGSVVSSAFAESFATDYIGNMIGAVMDRAREIAIARAAADQAGTLNPAGAPGACPTTPGNTGGAGGAGNLPDQLERMKSLLEEIRGPLDNYIADTTALQTLLAAGGISVAEYAEKWRELRIAFLDTQNTFAAGLERGLLKVYDDLNNIGQQIEDVFTNAFKSAEDAVVNFVMTGKLDIQSFISGVIEDLARLATQQLIMKPIAGALGGLLGIDLTGGAGGDSGGAALNASAVALTGSATALTSAAAALGASAGLGGGGIGAQLAAASGAASQAAGAAETAAGSIAQTPGIFSGFLGGLQGVFGNLMSGLGSIFSSIFGGGGGGGGFLSSLIGGIFGGSFATGGSFAVGGSGGVDSQMVAFRASPGERVNITRPGEESNSGGTQRVTMNVYTQDAESFKRSEGQISAKLARMTQRGRRNL